MAKNLNQCVFFVLVSFDVVSIIVEISLSSGHLSSAYQEVTNGILIILVVSGWSKFAKAVKIGC